MIARIKKVVTGPLAGPAAAAVALAMTAVLVVSWTAWSGERAELKGRIAELSQQAERSQGLLKAQLAACHAASGPQRLTEAAYEGGDGQSKDDAAASRLLAQGPEGIDVCARMESADQAVLSTLK